MRRKLVIAGLSGVMSLLLWCGQSSTQTPAKGAKDLKKEVDDLKKQLADRDKTIQSLKDTKANDKTLKAKLDAANQALADKDQTIAGLKKTIKDLAHIKNAPYVHSMVLKMKKDDDAEQIKLAMSAALKTLAKATGVRHVFAGKRVDFGSPSSSEPDFHVGVVVLLDDSDGLQKFLDDPLYKQFNDKVADYWNPPAVYDFLRDLPAVKK